MARIDDYNNAIKYHKAMVEIVEETKKEGNNLNMHYSKQEEIYHIVAFSLSNKHCSRHEYDKSERLAEYIGKACDVMKYKIIEKAIELSDKNTLEIALSAKKEAQEIIDTLSKPLKKD